MDGKLTIVAALAPACASILARCALASGQAERLCSMRRTGRDSFRAKRGCSKSSGTCSARGRGPAYFAAHGTPKSPADLGTHACATFEGLMSPDAWIFTADKSDTSVALHSRLVVNTAEAAIDAAIAGIARVRIGPARSPLCFKSLSRKPCPSVSSIPEGGSCHSSCAPPSISRHRG
jgi:hypothetical protein